MNIDHVVGGIGVAALFLLIGLAGQLEYQDEIQEEQRYVEMVCNQLWPDYQDTVNEEEECTDAQSR